MDFRGHSVLLPDGITTIPDKTPIQEDPRFHSAIRTIKTVLPQSSWTDLKLADYGCFEGGYSVAFAQKGLQVTGIEGREDNLLRCNWLKNRFQLNNLNFKQEDLAKPAETELFHISFVSGLLYHLEDPVSFLQFLGKTTEKLLILNTHFAEETVPSRFRHKLSSLTTHLEYQGRWYTESQISDSDPLFPRSSLHNKRSFWLTRPSLLRALRSAGFKLLFEQFDNHHDMKKGIVAIRRNSRSLFVAIK